MAAHNGSTVLSAANLVASLADNKRFLGRRYAEWCTGAPALEAAVAAAAMAQDEIGHARSLYPLWRDLSGQDIDPELRSSFEHVPFLGRPFSGWTDFIAANLIFDTALTVLFESARDSSIPGLAQRATRIVLEERMHWLHAQGWARRLANTGPEVREALQQSLLEIWPQTVVWFDVATADLVTEGVLAASGPTLRDEHRARLVPVVENSDLVLP